MSYKNREHWILFITLFFLSFVCCEQSDPQPDEVFLINLTEVTFQSEGGKKEVRVTSTVNWSVAVSKEWVSVNPDMGGSEHSSFEISVEANDEPGERTATVVVTSQSGEEFEIMIVQDAKIVPTPDEILVTTPSELNEAIVAAKAGDCIVMKNGVWHNVDMLIDAVGTEESPITLRAETPGQVVITGLSSLILRGKYLVVEGIRFRDGYSSKSLHLIEVRSSFTRITNCSIVKYNKPEGNDVWIGMFGSNNRVDHCYFEGKYSESVMIIIWRPTPESNDHSIDHNHFKDIPSIGLGGATAIRIGDGTNALSSSNTIVENNLFEEMLGIGKIVNIKSGGNIIRNNTFRNASGAICIRQGNNCVIEGNYVFPGLKDNYTGGILVIGENHIIRNNYIQGTKKIGKGAIVLYEGQSNNAPGVGGYYPTKNVLIESNTLVDNDKNIVVGNLYEPGTDIVVPVENITFKNNAVLGNGSEIPVISVLDPPIGEIVYEGNYFYNVNMAGLEGISGIIQQNPYLFFSQTEGYYKYSSSSPLKDNIIAPPLTQDQVGVSW